MTKGKLAPVYNDYFRRFQWFPENPLGVLLSLYPLIVLVIVSMLQSCNQVPGRKAVSSWN